MYKLSPAETFRYQVVLNEGLRQLSFLGTITTNVVAQKDELSQFMGDEISRIITEQRELERRYEELISARGNLKGLANKSKFRETQNEIQEVARALRESTKNLCRNLKDNPNVAGNLLKIQQERARLQELITELVNDLREYSFQGLVSQVDEERHNQSLLAEVKAREKEASNMVKQLQADLRKEMADHERESKEGHQVIARLKEELQEERTKSAIKLKYQEKEAKGREAAQLRIYAQKEKELRVQIEELTTKVNMEMTVHEQTRAWLEKRTESLKNEQNNWTDKHAQELEDIEDELENVQRAREEDLKSLESLQARLVAEAEEQAAVEAEEKRLLQMEEDRIKLKIKKVASANLIRQHWLDYKKQLADRPKTTKKGKKGKKGKKK